MSPMQHLKIARFLTVAMENQFKVGRFSFGLDPILGLIPGIGDAVSAALSIYLIYIGSRLKIPQEQINQMVGNVVVDFALGLIPGVGDFADFVFKANTRNWKIIEKYAPADFVEGEEVGKRDDDLSFAHKVRR